MELFFFLFFAFTAVVSGVTMIIQRNLIYCVLLLITVMVSLAGLFLLLNAQFVAVIQIVVYAGAIMVLFLFVIMLLNVRQEEHGTFRIQKPLGIILLILLLIPTVSIILSNPSGNGPPAASTQEGIGLGEVEQIGRLLFTKYLLPVELVGVLLLIAIVGAVVLTRHGTILSRHEGDG